MAAGPDKGQRRVPRYGLSPLAASRLVFRNTADLEKRILGFTHLSGRQPFAVAPRVRRSKNQIVGFSSAARPAPSPNRFLMCLRYTNA
ncbi:hypothetical protein GCM10007881_55830 [Mesorhizobium huakuii]|nr:hypothetical protein GCM10007881_55830 [Mesorhizobium huakuii]